MKYISTFFKVTYLTVIGVNTIYGAKEGYKSCEPPYSGDNPSGYPCKVINTLIGASCGAAVGAASPITYPIIAGLIMQTKGFSDFHKPENDCD
jgi:hypothetical protein